MQTLLSDIRDLIARNELDAALRGLRDFLDNSPLLYEALHHSGRWAAIRNQVRLGVVSHEDAALTENQVRDGLLAFLREIEEQGARPEFRKEVEKAVQVVNSKNVVIGSSIQAGGNVVIGDTTNITESQTSRRVRLFLYIFVPFLAIAAAVIWYRLQVMQRPLQLKVRVENLTPNPELPEPLGNLALTYGSKTEPKESISAEALFEGIPANFKGERLRLQYSAKGFVAVDTSFSFKNELIILPVRRNGDLAKIAGVIKDEEGEPVAGVRVSISACCSALTDSEGAFFLDIPFGQQKERQRLSVQKEGFLPKDITTPVIPGEPMRLILEKR